MTIFHPKSNDVSTTEVKCWILIPKSLQTSKKCLRLMSTIIELLISSFKSSLKCSQAPSRQRWHTPTSRLTCWSPWRTSSSLADDVIVKTPNWLSSCPSSLTALSAVITTSNDFIQSVVWLAKGSQRFITLNHPQLVGALERLILMKCIYATNWWWMQIYLLSGTVINHCGKVTASTWLR